jgi:alkanesulfonate monooxygenase SsuD/methylene tetrahydromethanopterin reductase-like flavin-dependent oxidoreductase (luciferase family)
MCASSTDRFLYNVAMRFALFYEIPVARPWGPDSERLAYQHTIEQAVAGEQYGWDAFWTVEHHFLEEYSHCSNPEVLYGAIAAKTERMRLGFGVRLMPKPYNHPVRTAESAAVLDLISNGRVDLGTGRSSTRAELEGFGIDPSETRSMWQEAIGHVVGCWTHDEYEFEGQHWSMPKRRVLPKPLQDPHPPIWGATSSEDGHRQVGELGLGLCSFAVGVPPEAVKEKIDVYRSAVAECTEPIGAYVHDQASTFTMAVCAPTKEEAWATARESFEWYPRAGARLIASVAEMQADRGQDLGTYGYAADLQQVASDGSLDLLTLEYLAETGACVLGTPDDCVELCRRYEAAGVDQLLCLVNPYKIPHEAVLQTIRMMGEHVIPEFR